MRRVERDLDEIYPNASIAVRALSIASVIGRDLAGLRVMARGLDALEEAGIEVVAAQQITRAVDVQFVVKRSDLDRAIKALHDATMQKDDAPVEPKREAA